MSQSKGYIHGYSSVEQDRLYRQARILEQAIYRNIDFSSASRILEVGSGVGAQTEILIRRYPHLKIMGVDASPEQIQQAESRLKPAVASGQVKYLKADATRLPFSENEFDGAFVCWLLEHVADPVAILKEVHRVLRPDAVIYCNEVLNATFFLHPYSPATLKYWFEFNDHQWNLGGDPFVGAKLANLLMKAGYREIHTKTVTQHHDYRTPKKRAEFIGFWKDLLLSGAPELLKAGKVDEATVEGMREEFDRVAEDPDSVIYYSWVQTRAVAL